MRTKIVSLFCGVPACVCVAGFLGLVCSAGGTLFALGAVLGVVAVAVWLPGYLCGVLCGAQQKGLRVVSGAVSGTAVFALSTVCASATGVHWLALAIPAALDLALCFALARKKPARLAGQARFDAKFLMLLTSALLLVFGLAACLPHARSAAVGAVTPNQDFFWNVGNAESFLLGFLPQDLRFAGYTLTYHYLTELLAAGISMASGVPCYDVLAFYLTPLILTALVAALWEMAQLVFAKQRVYCWLFMATVFLFGCAGMWKLLPEGMSPFWNLALRHLVTNINGVTTATLFLVCYAALLFWLLEHGFARHPDAAAAAGAAFLLLTLAKGPVAGLAAIATGCAAVLFLSQKCAAQKPRAQKIRFLLFALVIGAGFLVLYKWFFSAGAGTSVHFSATGTLEKSYFAPLAAKFAAKGGVWFALSAPLLMLAQAFCMTPAAFLLFFAGAMRDVPRLWRGNLAGARLFSTAMAVGGMAAFFLFDHEAMSQMYFAFAGLFFIGLLAVQNGAAICAWVRTKAAAGRVLRSAAKKALGVGALGGALLCAVSALSGLCTYAYFTRTGLQLLVNRPAVVAQQAARGKTPLTSAEAEAMDWLRAHMPSTALFATNRIHSGAAREGLSNVYTALAGRRAYMESFKYAVSNLGVCAQEVQRRVALVQELFGSSIQAARAAQLCAQESIDYVVYSRVPRDNDAAEGAGSSCFGASAPAGFETIFANEDVSIYRRLPEAAQSAAG